MAHAVIATFDSEADAAVRLIWESLASHGIDSSMTALGIAPHITLAVLHDATEDRLIDRVNTLGAQTAPFAIDFDRINTFEGRGTVFYLAPGDSVALRQLHQSYHENAADAGTCDPHYQPKFWVPHATIAMAVTEQSLAPANRLLDKIFSTFSAQITALAVVRFEPNRAVTRQDHLLVVTLGGELD